MLVFYSFVFMSLCCLLKLHSVCFFFFKYFSPPVFVGLDEEYKYRSSRPGSAAASLLHRQSALSLSPLLFFCSLSYTVF